MLMALVTVVVDGVVLVTVSVAIVADCVVLVTALVTLAATVSYWSLCRW